MLAHTSVLMTSASVAASIGSEVTRIDPDTLAQVERELTQTQRVLSQAEKDLKRAERKRKESVASAKKWRTRYEELRDTAAAPTPEAAPSPAEDLAAGNTSPESNPAAAAGPSSDPSPSSGAGGSQGRLERGILLPSETTGPATH